MNRSAFAWLFAILFAFACLASAGCSGPDAPLRTSTKPGSLTTGGK